MDESINRFKLLSFNLHLMAVIIVWSLVVIIIYSMITGNYIYKTYFCCCHHRKMSVDLLKNIQWHHAYKCSKNEVIRHKYPVVSLLQMSKRRLELWSLAWQPCHL